MKQKKQVKTGFTLIEFMIVIAIIAILGAILIPNYMRAKDQGNYTACQSNCKTIATGLEMHAANRQGVYPNTMQELIPDYIKEIPTCPVGGDVYVSSYEVLAAPNICTFYCSGSNHTLVPGVSANYPMYSSNVGLQIKP